jgi:hypothetical protein
MRLTILLFQEESYIASWYEYRMSWSETRKLGPEFRAAIAYSVAAHAVPELYRYLKETNLELSMSGIRRELRMTLDRLDGKNSPESYLRSASRLSGLALLLVYMKVTKTKGKPASETA